MLQLKKVSKTYRPKKGVPVEALKGITLSFGEKGLVFVLGKSGSGKSTLLNLIGGLDFADKGEIIIDGKSSKEFKAADYDAYRNTYIGFVFQEYNILNEYTVGENIMLALELQNKKADKKLLEKILKEVDLEGYAERKPNELSGGQKQRVAIARALIKQPQILMADEPTGALDSNTGKAILDTLKKISEEKLVIVVSHDREFAQKYGDRVIELADGEVISDESKTEDIQEKEQSEEKESKGKFVKSSLPYRHALRMGASSIKSKPIRLAVTILLCFLTFALFGVVDVVNSFSPRKILYDAYTSGEYTQLAFSAINKCDVREYELNGLSQEELNLLNIKSSNKFIGVTYFNKCGKTEIKFMTKELYGGNHSVYYSGCLYGFLPASEDFFAEQGFELTGVVPINDKEIVLTQYILDQINISGCELKVYKDGMLEDVKIIPDKYRTAKNFVDGEYYIELEENNFKIVGIIDTKPDPQGIYDWLKPSPMQIEYNEEYANAQSACSKYFRYGYHSLGYINQNFYQSLISSHKFNMASWDSFGRILGGEIEYSGKKGEFEIVASSEDLNKTSGVIWLDGNERTSLQDNEIVVGLNFGVNLLRTNYDNNLFYRHSKDNYFNDIVKVNEMNFQEFYSSKRIFACLEEADRIDISKLEPFKEFIRTKCALYGERAVLNELLYMSHYNGVVVDDTRFVYRFEEMDDNLWRYGYAKYLATEMFAVNIGTIGNSKYVYFAGGYYDNILDMQTGKSLENIDGKRMYIEEKIRQGNSGIIKSNVISWNFEDTDAYNLLPSNYDSWDVVGIYIPRDDFPELEEKDTVIYNNIIYKKAETAKEIIYNFAIAPMPTEKKRINNLIDLHLLKENGRNLRICDNTASLTKILENSFVGISKFMVYAGIGVALFSILLMSNYIAISISSRKRDIGILRALGAKTSDVFAIFVNESIIMAVINSILSIFVALGASIGINKFMQAKYMADFTILSFGIRQVAIILCISIAVAVIASLIPIYRLSKKKPIDCIQDR